MLFLPPQLIEHFVDGTLLNQFFHKKYYRFPKSSPRFLKCLSACGEIECRRIGNELSPLFDKGNRKLHIPVGAHSFHTGIVAYKGVFRQGLISLFLQRSDLIAHNDGGFKVEEFDGLAHLAGFFVDDFLWILFV